jgi:hypothetical protein
VVRRLMSNEILAALFGALVSAGWQTAVGNFDRGRMLAGTLAAIAVGVRKTKLVAPTRRPVAGRSTLAPACSAASLIWARAASANAPHPSVNDWLCPLHAEASVNCLLARARKPGLVAAAILDAEGGVAG